MKPSIVINTCQLRDKVAAALEALRKCNDPPYLFNRGGVPVRLGGGEAGLEPMDDAALLAELAEAADWFRRDRSGSLMEAESPTSVIRAIRGRREHPFPVIEGITHAPFFTADGGLVITAGYHQAPRVYLSLEPRLAAALASRSFKPAPAAAELADACGLLAELFFDFPFIDLASCAHAVALTLLPFVRLMIAGPTPNHAVSAPPRGEGTGKGLLIQTACAPALGEISASPETGNQEELRKTLLAAVIENAPVVWFDNVRGEVSSGVLAAILTSNNWADRVLGKSKRFRGRVLSTWCVAGNALRFSREIARRTVLIELDAAMPCAWTRTGFRHELPAWALENRARLIAACVTLVHHWIAVGRPPGKRVLGSFEAWSRVMGGILEAAGIGGFLANMAQESDEHDRETDRWQPFIDAWWRRHGETPATPGVLLPFAESVLPDDGRSERSRATRLGLLLAERVRATFEVESCTGAYVHIVRAQARRSGGRSDPGFALRRLSKHGEKVREVGGEPAAGSTSMHSFEERPENPVTAR